MDNSDGIVGKHRPMPRKSAGSIERQRWETLSRFESPHWLRQRLVAGVDEVGRGPLAGPVVAAAVILDPTHPIFGVRDSKLLSAHQRDRLYPEILAKALAIGVGMVGPRCIERINILEATRKAMQQALRALPFFPDVVLTDAMQLGGDWHEEALVHGDRLSVSIGAASIVAKVIRDRYMESMDVSYPGYGFTQHKGYPTVEHRARLAQLGPTACHRSTFKWEPP